MRFSSSNPHHKPREVYVPMTTNQVVIFPLDGSKGFYSGRYYSSQTEERASLEEVNNTLREVAFAYKPFDEKIFWSVLCFVVNVFLSLAAFILILKFVAPLKPVVLFPVSIGLFFIWTMISSLIFAFSISRHTKNGTAACQKVIDKYNQEFSKRGLRWVLPKHFPKWIELHNDFRKEQSTPFILQTPDQKPILESTDHENP